MSLSPGCTPGMSGYRRAAAAGFECGAARGGAATLRAMAHRLPPKLASQLQQVQQGQQEDGLRQLAEMPFQRMQQQVCTSLMAAAEKEAASPAAGTGSASADAGPMARLLPVQVQAAVQAARDVLQQVGLQPPG